jgi:predicted nucleic acid-binding protein
LNEFVHAARRKLGHDWPQIKFALGQLLDALDDVVPVNLKTPENAVSVARDHGLSFYDVLIFAAAWLGERDFHPLIKRSYENS